MSTPLAYYASMMLLMPLSIQLTRFRARYASGAAATTPHRVSAPSPFRPSSSSGPRSIVAGASPRPGALPVVRPGHVIPQVGGWGDLAQQLQQKKQQLAGNTSQPATPSRPVVVGGGGPAGAGAQAGSTPSRPAAGSASAAGTPVAQQPGDAAGGASAGQGVGAPGAVRPRGGARRTAIGPLLNRLRAEAAAGEGQSPLQQ